uniref:Mannose-P-dolichol utilization defect 1 protein homolog n=1 Tax=Timema bartmani TaxID=61472 RepID=A0A7R9EX14_9NEOP|nr:unnamed protein product [Timema bartmani]
MQSKNAQNISFSINCHPELFARNNFLNRECWLFVLSKCLGYIIVLSSVVIKIPQIVKIVSVRSAEGLSIASVLMDLYGQTAGVAYSFNVGLPFSSWGDGLFAGVQTVIVTALLFYYSAGTPRTTTFLTLYCAIIAILLSGYVPVNVLWTMNILNLPLIVLSGGSQASSNYRNSSTGQLSAVTVALHFLGALARIFTSVQETGDTAIIVTNVVATVVSFIIVLQMWYYWDYPAQGTHTDPTYRHTSPTYRHIDPKYRYTEQTHRQTEHTIPDTDE